jgi:outer membrane protein TolC
VRLGALVLLFCLSGAGFGQSVLTFDDGLSEAAKSNPALQSADSAADAARDIWKGTIGAFMPTVSGILQEERSDVLLPQSSLNQGQSTVYSWGPEVSWGLFSGFASVAATKQAFHNFKAAEATERNVSASVRLNFRTYFGELLFLKQDIELLKSIAAKLHADADFVKIEYQGGVGARWNYLEAESQAEEADWEVYQAQTEVRSTRQHVLALLGRPQFEELTVTGSLEVPHPPGSSDEFVIKALSDHPNVVFQKEQIEVARGGVLGAASQFIPTLNATYSYLWQDDVWPPQTRTWDLTAGFNIPIFNGGSSVEAYKQAKTTVQEQRQTLSDVQNTVKSAIEDAFAAYRALDARLKAVRAELAAEAEREETVRAEYKAGRASYFEWNTAVNSYVTLQKQELQSMLDDYNALGAWESSLGLGAAERQ